MVGMEWLLSSAILITPALVFASHRIIRLHLDCFVRPLGLAALTSDESFAVFELLILSYLDHAFTSAGVGCNCELVA